MDPKMRLQYCLNEFNTHEGLEGSRQALRKTFCVLDEWGPSHERMYLVGCYIHRANAPKQLVAQARLGLGLGLLGLGLGLANPSQP